MNSAYSIIQVLCMNNVQHSNARTYEGGGGGLATVEPPYKDTFGTNRYVLRTEIVLFQRYFSVECVYYQSMLDCPLLED